VASEMPSWTTAAEHGPSTPPPRPSVADRPGPPAVLAGGGRDGRRRPGEGRKGAGLEPRVLRYVAGAGERNEVGIMELERSERDLVRVRDAAGVEPGPGCRRSVTNEPTVAVCSFSAPGEDETDHPNVLVLLGDGSDTLRVRDEGLGAAVLAGSGVDSIVGGTQNNFYDLGTGEDEVSSQDAGTSWTRAPVATEATTSDSMAWRR